MTPILGAPTRAWPDAAAWAAATLAGLQPAAHADHLALYVHLRPPPLRLRARVAGGTGEQLAGRWAPSLDYGLSIVRDDLGPLLAWTS